MCIYIHNITYIYVYLSHGSPLHHPDFSIEPKTQMVSDPKASDDSAAGTNSGACRLS